MNLQDATTLISNRSLASLQLPTTWADLGCGDGLFTHALAFLLDAGSTIFAIDKKLGLDSSMESNGTMIKSVIADFEKGDIPFDEVDGILMANSFHYVQQKEQFLGKILSRCKHQLIFIVVEYEMETANRWVPYPINFSKLEQLFTKTGFLTVSQIGTHPSMYNNESMYAALAIKLRKA